MGDSASSVLKGYAGLPMGLRILKGIIIIVLCFQLASCGTILYPERKGQKAGRLDVGVVLMDAIGLFFFLIPGVIAFAVDLSNGTIYLPETAKTQSADQQQRIVRFDPNQYSPVLLQAIIRRETGQSFTLADERLQIIRLENVDEVPVYLAQFQPTFSLQLSLLSEK
jgi:hypothetical protein